jgi:hypothetical protein
MYISVCTQVFSIKTAATGQSNVRLRGGSGVMLSNLWWRRVEGGPEVSGKAKNSEHFSSMYGEGSEDYKLSACI